MTEKVSFTDAKGREWHPEVTGRVIRDYEKLSGVGLFKTVFNIFIEDQLSLNDAETTEPKDSQIFRMAAALFGNMGHLEFLLYESCRNTQGKVVATVSRPIRWWQRAILWLIKPFCSIDMTQKVKQSTKEVSYDDFCDAIKDEYASSAVVAAIEALFHFFPTLTEKEGGDRTESDPSGLGLGRTSLSSQG